MALFVALVPDDAAVDELRTRVAPAREAAPELHWTDPRDWHVTLAFLGASPETVIVPLVDRLVRATRRHRVGVLRCAAGGAFGRPSAARVLWVRFTGDVDGLRTLARSVQAAARRSGAPPADEGRPYRPHLTLARSRSPVDLQGLIERIDGEGPSWPATDVRLMRSVPGHPYETLWRAGGSGSG